MANKKYVLEPVSNWHSVLSPSDCFIYSILCAITVGSSRHKLFALFNSSQSRRSFIVSREITVILYSFSFFCATLKAFAVILFCKFCISFGSLHRLCFGFFYINVQISTNVIIVCIHFFF